MTECYLDPMATNREARNREGWWEGIMDSITTEELEDAIGKSKSGCHCGRPVAGGDRGDQGTVRRV